MFGFDLALRSRAGGRDHIEAVGCCATTMVSNTEEGAAEPVEDLEAWDESGISSKGAVWDGVDPS